MSTWAGGLLDLWGVEFYENQPRDIFPGWFLNPVDMGTRLDDDNVAWGLRALVSFAI